MEIIRLNKNIEKTKLNDILLKVVRLEETVFGEGSWDQDYLSKILDNDFDHFFVALNSQEVCGYGIIRVLWDADILSIAVREDMRRKGVGGDILGKMLGNAFQYGSKRVFLEARSHNTPAKRLYEASGFKVIGIRKDYYTSPLDDALLMMTEF